jgi:hypothetical protein
MDPITQRPRAAGAPTGAAAPSQLGFAIIGTPVLTIAGAELVRDPGRGTLWF